MNLAPAKTDPCRGSCQCGGHGGARRPEPTALIFTQVWPGPKPVAPPTHACGCSHRACPRRYHSAAGLILGGLLVSHLAISALGLWPAVFQSVVSRIHQLGPALTWLELTLIGIPLLVHVGMGLNYLCKAGPRPGVEKQHHGSDLRYWLQRVSAVVLLGFITFHVITLHRWGVGRFDPQNAFSSTTEALRHFWTGHGSGSPANLLIAQFYLLGIAAAVYHLANGVATSAEVWNLTPTRAGQIKLWRTCIVAGVVLGTVGLTAWYAFTVA